MKSRARGAGVVGAFIIGVPLSLPAASMSLQNGMFAVKAAQVLSFAREMNAGHSKTNASSR